MTDYSCFTFQAGLLPLKSAEADVSLLQQFNVDRICVLDQISTDKIVTIDYRELDNLPLGLNKLGSADAVIIKNYIPKAIVKNLFGITTADCLPVLIHAQDQIALIHAGWRGLALQIIQKTVNQMNIDKSCKVFIGAAAKGCCYEVGPEVLEALNLKTEPVKQKIDLQVLAEKIFQDLLPGSELKSDSRCTICTKELHSYRRDRTRLRNLSFVIM